MKSHLRRMKYSLSTLCLLILIVSMCFAFYASQARTIRQHHEAVAQIQRLGGRPELMTQSGFIRSEFTDDDEQLVFWPQESFLDVIFGRPSLGLAGMHISDPELTEDDIRAMIPHMRKIILLPINEKFDGVFIDAIGNGSLTYDLAEAIRSEFPSYYFITVEYLQNPTEHPIQKGMTARQVERAVAKKLYNQRTDWVGDPGPILKMLGDIHQAYQNADGTTTWLYGTDDIGVGTIVIDFDKTQRVDKISLSHGIPDRLVGSRLLKNW